MPNNCVGCLDATNILDVSPVCSTTTYTLPDPADCVATSFVATPVSEYQYCCNSISIFPFAYKLCANCPCFVTGIQITTLPTDGTLSIDGEDIVLDQVIPIDKNGLIIYTKDVDFVGTDTFQFLLVSDCGDSDEVTVTIVAKDVDCSAPETCGCIEITTTTTTEAEVTTTTTAAPTTTTTTT